MLAAQAPERSAYSGPARARRTRYRDVVYVEELIGPDTVNTIPPATFEAFRDHGRPRASLTEDVDAARDTMNRLAQVGISMEDVTDRLLAEGCGSSRMPSQSS